MLEKPVLDDGLLLACLREHYQVDADSVVFLPIGADRHTAVYRAHSAGSTYFVKLRSGEFNQSTVTIPKLLNKQGIAQVIAPIANRDSMLWTALEPYRLILYPFVVGHDGFTRRLNAHHWAELGRALRQIHTVELPPAAVQYLPRETFSPYWREQVSRFMAQAESDTFHDATAAALAVLLRTKKQDIHALLTHAHELARRVQRLDLPSVLCHADIHVGNVLITPDDRLYVVDWDTLMLAPKERDLMFMGMGMSHHPQYTQNELAAQFYQGYGAADVAQVAIAYYRCERIVQDIYAYCEQILFTSGDSPDRQEGLRQLQSQFEPDAVVDHALRSVEKTRSAM